MATGTVLFERKQSKLGSDTGESSSVTDDASWDDKVLIDAFDEAAYLAKCKIAARMIARGEQPLENGIEVAEHLESDFRKPVKSKKSKKKSNKGKIKCEVGAPCRAIFSEDGREYEAIIQSVNQNKGTCVVKYIGYDNEEEVPSATLRPSQGATARQYQIQQALENAGSDNITETEDDGEHVDPFEDITSNGASWIGQSEFYNSRQDPFLHTPFLPSQNPMNVPIPPPPPPYLTSQFPEEDSEALSAMLLSWYMSGFHTGYYQGLKDAKKGRHKLSQARMYSRKK